MFPKALKFAAILYIGLSQRAYSQNNNLWTCGTAADPGLSNSVECANGCHNPDGPQMQNSQATGSGDGNTIYSAYAADTYLGMAYEFGLGVTKDLPEAARLLTKAAVGGDPDGTAQLGVLYFRGDGVPRNLTTAFLYYSQSVALGSSWGEAYLGELFDLGKGVPQDYAQAATLYMAAAAQHNTLAEYKLGLLYQAGKGVPQDYQKAFGWYYEASKFGNAASEVALANLYNLGLGVAADQARPMLGLRWQRTTETKTLKTSWRSYREWLPQRNARMPKRK